MLAIAAPRSSRPLGQGEVPAVDWIRRPGWIKPNPAELAIEAV
jgi:hypothetical protein